MTQSSNKISQFWQELKRRNVTRVLAVYIAAAFMVLELVAMISDPFGLPVWLLKVAFFILIAGLVIAVIVSWIYDIQPEGGIVKTEPAKKVSEEATPSSSSSWRIASYISFVVIVALIVLNVIPRSTNKKMLEKSIAVLPFENMSSDEGFSHIGGAFTDEIIMELQKIKTFDRVLSRTSTMQYAENRPTISEIAEKLNVNYIIEGSVQRYDDDIRIRVQVIRANNENQVWGNEYDRKWNDLFSIQDDIAHKVANELKTILSPEEAELIEKVPTTNLTAYDFYQRAKEKHLHFQIGYQVKTLDPNVEILYKKAIEYDSTFAEAYIGLAQVYWDKHYWDNYFSQQFLDSMLSLVDIALSFDSQISEAYTLMGDYYREIGQINKALNEYAKAIELNSNNWLAYAGKATASYGVDNIEVISNLQKSISLNRGKELPDLLFWLGSIYGEIGFEDKNLSIAQEILSLTGESANYHEYLSSKYQRLGIFLEALEYAEIGYPLDTNNTHLLYQIGHNYYMLGRYEESLKYFTKHMQIVEHSGTRSLNYLHRFGHAYWETGDPAKGLELLNKQVEYCDQAIALGREYSTSYNAYYDLAAVNAFRDEKNSAYKNLRIYIQKPNIGAWMLTLLKSDPLFANIRDEPEFQQIVRDVEAKYQAEHERVRRWLEENDMI